MASAAATRTARTLAAESTGPVSRLDSRAPRVPSHYVLWCLSVAGAVRETVGARETLLERVWPEHGRGLSLTVQCAPAVLASPAFVGPGVRARRFLEPPATRHTCVNPSNWCGITPPPDTGALGRSPCEVVECGNGPRTENAPWPSIWTSLEALTARFDSLGYQVDGRLRPRVSKAHRDILRGG